jgi:hypothetical protein
MKLRPHHLICTLGYEGKGYSEKFVAHMNEITERLRKKDGLRVEVVQSTDDICSHCPHMLDTDLCEKNEAVKEHDQKVYDALGLEEREYAYSDLLDIIRQKVNPDVLCYLCGDCMWLPLTDCRRLILDFLD